MNTAVRSSMIYMVISVVIVMLLIFVWRMKTHSLSRGLSDGEKRDAVYSKYEEYRASSFPGVKDISPRDAMALLEAGRAVFVDVRDPREQEVSMLPGAVPQKDFMKDPARYGDKTIIGYCTVSYRSGILAQDLTRKGIEMVNLRGGMLAWVHEGGSLVDSKGESRRVHVYSKNWDFLPEGYEGVW